MADELHRRTPFERRAGTPTLTEEQAAALDAQVDSAWRREGSAIRRRFEFKTFAQAFAFATRLALLAEKHGHHPDLSVGWGYVEAVFSTHSVGGLTENDYIMAARIDRLS
jgi:4a-hydroxytetrahydrobiopterin dehydratase